VQHKHYYCFDKKVKTSARRFYRCHNTPTDKKYTHNICAKHPLCIICTCTPNDSTAAMRNALIKHRVENAKHKQRKPTKKTVLNAALAPPAQFTSAHFCKQVKSKTNTTMLYLSRAVSGACCRSMHDAHKKNQTAVCDKLSLYHSIVSCVGRSRKYHHPCGLQ